MADERDLEQVRADIDAIDRELQALINRRAGCAQRVAEIKLAEAQPAVSPAKMSSTTAQSAKHRC
jgi:chorismate mutase/prephenate dehydratase